jgi:hypothetical protein
LDDFTVKYVGKQHAAHLRDALLRSYEHTTGWEGKSYSGMTLKWDYQNRTCNISIPGYVANVLRNSNMPRQSIHNTHILDMACLFTAPKPSIQRRIKYLPSQKKQCLGIQKVTGSILYYARVVDPTVMMSLNDIATEQTKATEKTQAENNHLLDYLATHPDATIRYHASYMILHIHSDA